MNANFTFQSVNSVTTSWDNVRKIPNYEKKIAKMMFEKLQCNSDWSAILPNVVSCCNQNSKEGSNLFDGAKFDARSFDLVIHMLGPDLELVEEYLFDLGSQHALDYGLEQKHYPILGQVLIESLEQILGKDKFSSTTKDSWKSIYFFSSTCMVRGAMDYLSRKNQI